MHVVCVFCLFPLLLSLYFYTNTLSGRRWVGLKRGDITPQHLYQQLANPAMQPRHREMLLTILKMQQQQQQQQTPQQAPPPQPQVQPAVVSVAPPPVPPQAVSPNFYTQQQLRVSPLTPNGEANRYLFVLLLV